MNSILLFDFSIDKETNTVLVKREFAATATLVWDAWTKPNLLDQWWAPKPYQTQTKSMDFREGGYWFYAMVSPEGEKHWCRNDYQKIEDQHSYTALDAFCDETGALDPNLPRTLWTNEFNAMDDTTLVSITAKYDSLADLEKIMEMGFQEGFTMALGNLDELLARLV